MSERSETEAKRIVDEVFSGFADLRAEDDKNVRILYGRHAEDLLKDLEALKLDKQWAVPGAEMERWSHDAQRGATVDLMFSIVPHSARQAEKGDRLESGGSWLQGQYDKDNLVSEAMRRVLVTRPYVGVWELFNPFQLPTDDKLAEAYEKTYFPMRLEVDTPQTSAMYEDGGKTKLAVRKFKRTMANIAMLYDKQPDKRRKPMDIWDEDYAGYRGAFKTGEWTDKELYGDEMTCWYLDDGEHQCHYVEFPNQGLVPISVLKENEPYSNPLGRPMFRWGSSYFNPDATKPADRYRALLWPVYRAKYQQDQTRSLLMSYMAALHRLEISLTDDALAEMQKLDGPKARAEFLDTQMMRDVQGAMVHFGTMKQLDMPMPEILANELKRQDVAIQAMAPVQMPPEETLRYGAASWAPIREEYKEGMFSTTRSAIARIVHGYISDTLDLYRYSAKSRFSNAPGVAKTFDLWGAETGREYMKSRKARPGNIVHLDAKTLGDDDSWYTLVIEPVDNTISARQARMSMAESRYAAGLTTEYQRFEENDFSNPTDQLMRIEEDRVLKGLDPQLRAIAPAWATLDIVKKTGIGFGELLQLFTNAAMPAAGPEGVTQTPQAEFQMKSPEVQQDQLAAR